MTDHLRNEVAADALTERDDEAEWEAMRNLDLGLEPGWVTTDDMHQTWADDFAPVQAAYDPKDFGEWDMEHPRDW